MRKYLRSFAVSAGIALMLTACGGGDAASEQQPPSAPGTSTPTATPTSTPTATPASTEDKSIAGGSTELKVVTSDSNRVGYTMSFDWMLQDPRYTEVNVVDGDALGTNDLSITFDSSMQFGNTTKGSRTFFLADDGGVGILIRYPGSSPVCKYAPQYWAENKKSSCFIDTWDGTIEGVRFKDFPTLNDLTEGDLTDVLQTTHEVTLRDVPEADADRVSAALLNHDGVVVYLHYGDTTDKFKSSCDQAALKNVEYASLYVALGTVGSTNHCKA